MDVNRIICGDALSVLKTLPSDSVDLILTDPPYGLNIDYGKYIDTKENLVALINSFIPEARRVAKRVIVFPGVHNIWVYPPADWTCCWFYGTTGSWGKYGYNAWQPLLAYGPNNRRYGMDTIKYSKLERRYPGHPCSKPLGLIQEVVKRFSEPSDLVLDPFLGSGTTAVAAKQLGRNYLGIEMNPEYVKIAEKRLAEVQEPLLSTY